MSSPWLLLLFLLRGRLPWQGVRLKSRKARFSEIGRIQADRCSTPGALAKGFPELYARFLRYARNLKLRQSFIRCMVNASLTSRIGRTRRREVHG